MEGALFASLLLLAAQARRPLSEAQGAGPRPGGGCGTRARWPRGRPVGARKTRKEGKSRKRNLKQQILFFLSSRPSALCSSRREREGRARDGGARAAVARAVCDSRAARGRLSSGSLRRVLPLSGRPRAAFVCVRPRDGGLACARAYRGRRGTAPQRARCARAQRCGTGRPRAAARPTPTAAEAAAWRPRARRSANGRAREPTGQGGGSELGWGVGGEGRECGSVCVCVWGRDERGEGKLSFDFACRPVLCSLSSGERRGSAGSQRGSARAPACGSCPYGSKGRVGVGKERQRPL